MGFSEFIVVGAGPCGLSCAASFTAAGLSTVILEKGCLVDSIYRFPDGMQFFSGPGALEIGDLRLRCVGDHPTRREALGYYRQVVRALDLDVRQFSTVERIQGADGDFLVNGHRARKVVIATGYYSWPNLLGIPGENLPKVMHYFRDEHPYADSRVMVIGGGNSAGNTALALANVGAEVTLVHRRERLSMKPWLRESVESAIAEGRIRAFRNSRALQIELDCVLLSTPPGRAFVPNDFVFAMTGYHSDTHFLCVNGIPLPLDTETRETGRRGIYLAGSVCGGGINIENGRSHGEAILRHSQNQPEHSGVSYEARPSA